MLFHLTNTTAKFNFDNIVIAFYIGIWSILLQIRIIAAAPVYYLRKVDSGSYFV